MGLFSNQTHTIIPKSISATLVAVMVLNSLFFALIFYPQKAEAQMATIEANATVLMPIQTATQLQLLAIQGGQLAEATAADTKTGLFEIWNQFKSNHGIVAEVVSTLLLIMMHQVLAKMTNDIVAWINGGGKGKIRVLQDPGAFLAEAADEAGGVLAGAILNVDPKTLCDASYLKFKLKATFAGPYAVPTFDEKVACTFTGAAEGLQKFQEDFRNGGWDSFIEIARKENNQIGQTLIVNEELKNLSSDLKETRAATLSISKGFLAQEKCIITEAPAKLYVGGTGGAGTVSYDPSGFVGKTLEEVMEQTKNDYPAGSPDAFKTLWKSLGGKMECKTVTPAEQISALATNALLAPIKRLEDSITGLTNNLGTGAGSVIKPYVLAIANAGLNLLLKKEIGLITSFLPSAKKSTSTRRQTTNSLQENTMLAQSAGALAASMTDFRSFLLKAVVDFSIFVSNASDALNKIDVLGRTPLNKVETEIRGGTWYLGGGCPEGYFGTGVSYFSTIKNKSLAGTPHPCNTTAADVNAPATRTPGRTFFEEEQWCGAYSQELPITAENVPQIVMQPIAGSDPIPLSALGGMCPSLTYTTPAGVKTIAGDCSNATWVQYNLDGIGAADMATRLMAYDDENKGEGDRYLRQSVVGADTNNDGVPDGPIVPDATNITFEETVIDRNTDSNHSSTVDGISAATPAELRGIFEMQPNFSNTIVNGPGASLPVGLAQAASAGGYLFGGYNRFGHSDLIVSLASGTVVAHLPFGISGATAILYPPTGRIYLFGGYNHTKALDTIMEYDPSNNVVRTMSSRLPSPMLGASAAYYPPTGRIYLFGGAPNDTISDHILEYNQATDTLVTKNAILPIPLAFSAAATASLDAANKQRRIYLFGGITEGGSSSGAIFEYNPVAADTASAVARKLTTIEPRGYLAAVNTAPTAIAVYGGQSEFGLLATSEQYNTATDSAVTGALAEPLSKGAGGMVGATAVVAGGIVPAAGTSESAKIFPQGDIYHIPAAVHAVSETVPFWQKLFSAKFEGGTASLINTRTTTSYADFTAALTNLTISSVTGDDATQVWLSPSFYPELFEKEQELMEKIRVINGYNYPASNTKGYRSGLANQLGANPDDDPYDNNPSNPAYQDRIDQNGDLVEGYKGSVTDVLTKYTDLTQIYQALFAGLANENALEGVDKDMKILSPEETNIKLSFIGSRCPVLPPSATSSADLLAKCPRFGDEYNMARRFIFEADDTGANPKGITTGFATNPFTGEKSSALAGILNLDEMATQLQSLPPDKNIIKLIRLRQILERLQVWKSIDPSSADYQKSIVQIPMQNEAGVFIKPNALTGVDTIRVSLPGYEKIEKYLNATSTVDALGNEVPDKNRSIQTLIEDYGYTSAKDAYPEISKQLDEVFDDATGQVTDKLKEVFLKRIETQLEESRVVTQHRLQKFIEYVRDINPVVKLEVSPQRGEELAAMGASVTQISGNSSVIQMDAEQMFVNNGLKINTLLGRSPLRLTDKERSGIIGSAIYKIRTIASFVGADTSSAEFATQLSRYVAASGGTVAEQQADLDARVKNVLRDVYMYYGGVFNQTDVSLPKTKRDIAPTCTYDDTVGKYYCDLTALGSSGAPVRIFKDARTKIEELNNDFSLMVDEVSKITEGFRTLMSGTSSQKQEIEDLVKTLSAIASDYNNANKCVGMSLSSGASWDPPTQYARTILTSTLGVAGLVIGFIDNALLGGMIASIVNSVASFFGLGGSGWKAKEAARAAAQARQDFLNSCQAAINSYNKHLGQLADQFICNKINPKYED